MLRQNHRTDYQSWPSTSKLLKLLFGFFPYIELLLRKYHFLISSLDQSDTHDFGSSITMNDKKMLAPIFSITTTIDMLITLFNVVFRSFVCKPFHSILIYLFGCSFVIWKSVCVNLGKSALKTIFSFGKYQPLIYLPCKLPWKFRIHAGFPSSCKINQPLKQVLFINTQKKEENKSPNGCYFLCAISQHIHNGICFSLTNKTTRISMSAAACTQCVSSLSIAICILMCSCVMCVCVSERVYLFVSFF